MSDDAMDPNDPRAMAAASSQDAATGDNSAAAPQGPTGHYVPPTVPPSASGGTSAPATDPTADAAPSQAAPAAQPATPLTLPDTDPEVSYVAHAKNDASKLIVLHGRMHRSALSAYDGLYTVMEVSAVSEIAMIGSGTYRIDDNNQIVATVIVPELEEVRAKAILGIDINAEQARLKFVTPGSGQALVYQAKKEEAVKFLLLYNNGTDAQAAKNEDWPLISAELGVTADSLWLVAQTINYLANSWVDVAAKIEAIRLKLKDEVNKAQSVDDIRAVLTAIVWPTA